MKPIDKITKLSYNNTINLQGKLISLQNPLIMGILNLTKDSFYDGGKYKNNKEKAILHAKEMIEAGADIIDIGACSTRPNSALVSQEEELKEIIPVIRGIRKEFPQIIISIDTVWAEVAERAIKEGGNIINDISGEPSIAFKDKNGDNITITKRWAGDPSTNLDLKLSGRTVDAVYADLIKQISNGMVVTDAATDLKQGVQNTIAMEKCDREIARLELKIKNEKQFNRKLELRAELKKLKGEQNG